MWKGIVGKSFTQQSFRDYVKSLDLLNNSWRPEFIVLHNTSAPKISQWHSVSGQQRMANLENFYKNEQKWSAGPHCFIADDFIWVFTPLTTTGVHSPSWNAISWGIEMVGEYDEEPFDSGMGLAVQKNAISCLATLCEFGNLDSHTLHFHKEDPKTTHKDCPGKNVSKVKMIQAIHDELIKRKQ